MHDSDCHKFLELNWRAQRSEADEMELRQWLADHPEMAADRDREVALTQALGHLPDVEVPSNFTARVLSRTGALRPGQLSPGPTLWTQLWRPLLRRAALALVLVAAGVFGFHRHQVDSRAKLGRNIAAISSVAAEPGPEVLQDFEAIRRLDQMPRPDEQLLALLK
jgi:hypothetical protein